jgi:hypothetical protein
MELAMKSCSQRDNSFNESAARILRAALWERKVLGLKQEHAADDASNALGTIARRIIAIIRGEPVVVKAEEMEALAARRWADAIQKRTEIIAMLNQNERQAEAEWEAQFQGSLDLTSPTSRHGARRGATNGRLKP